MQLYFRNDSSSIESITVHNCHGQLIHVHCDLAVLRLVYSVVAGVIPSNTVMSDRR